MFDDFRKGVKKRPNQQQSDGKVVKRKRGRTRKENNTDLHLMIDSALKEQFVEYVEKNGKGSMSRVIEDFVRELVNKK